MYQPDGLTDEPRDQQGNTTRWHSIGAKYRQGEAARAAQTEQDLAAASIVQPLLEPVPLVTVIIPAYNANETLAEMVTSLAGQTFDGSWQILIVDDCSTDATRQLVGQLAEQTDVHVALIGLSVNVGVSRVRNVGIRASSSEVVLFVDADDWVTPNYVASQVEALTRESGPAMSFALLDSSVFGGDSGEVSGTVQRTKAAIIYGDIPATTSAAMGITRSALERIGTFDSGMVGCEDFELCVRSNWAGIPLRQTVDATVFYRQRGRPKDVYRQRIAYSKSHVRMTKKYWPVIDRRRYLYWQLRGIARWPRQLGLGLRLYAFPGGNKHLGAEQVGAVMGYVSGSINERFLLVCPWGRMLDFGDSEIDLSRY